MNRAVLLLLALTSCARPLYREKTDAEMDAFRGSPRRVVETTAEQNQRLVIDLNPAGNITRMDTYALDENVNYLRQEWTFGEGGLRLEKYTERDPRRPDGALTREITYDYDAAGRLTGERETVGGVGEAAYSYDAHGYPAVRTEGSSILRYRYDTRGRLRSEKGAGVKRYYYHPDGVTKRIKVRGSDRDLYDERGNLVSASSIVKHRNAKYRVTGRHKVTVRAEYEFDRHENWTLRTRYWDGKVQSVTTRKIEYYN